MCQLGAGTVPKYGQKLEIAGWALGCHLFRVSSAQAGLGKMGQMVSSSLCKGEQESLQNSVTFLSVCLSNIDQNPTHACPDIIDNLIPSVRPPLVRQVPHNLHATFPPN